MSLTSILASNKIGAGYSAPSAGRVFWGRVGGDPGEIRAARSAWSVDRVADGAKVGRRADRRRGFGLAAATDAFLRVSGSLRVACRNGQGRNGAITHAFPPIFKGQSSNRQLAPAPRCAIEGTPRLAGQLGARGGAFPLSARAVQPSPRRAGAAGNSDDFALAPTGGHADLAIRARTGRPAFGSGCGEFGPCEKSARGARNGGEPTGQGGKVHQVLSDGAKGATLGGARNRVN